MTAAVPMNTVATYSCNAMYVLSGDPTLQCVSATGSARWSDIFPPACARGNQPLMILF